MLILIRRAFDNHNHTQTHTQAGACQKKCAFLRKFCGWIYQEWLDGESSTIRWFVSLKARFDWKFGKNDIEQDGWFDIENGANSLSLSKANLGKLFNWKIWQNTRLRTTPNQGISTENICFEADIRYDSIFFHSSPLLRGIRDREWERVQCRRFAWR